MPENTRISLLPGQMAMTLKVMSDKGKSYTAGTERIAGRWAKFRSHVAFLYHVQKSTLTVVILFPVCSY